MPRVPPVPLDITARLLTDSVWESVRPKAQRSRVVSTSWGEVGRCTAAPAAAAEEEPPPLSSPAAAKRAAVARSVAGRHSVEAMVSVSAWASEAASALATLPASSSSPPALSSPISALLGRSAFCAKELPQLLLLATDKARPKSLILGQPSELADPRKVDLAGRSSVVVGECGEIGDCCSSPSVGQATAPDADAEAAEAVAPARNSRAFTDRGVDCAEATTGTATPRRIDVGDAVVINAMSANRGSGGPAGGGPCMGDTPPMVGVAGEAMPVPSSRVSAMVARRGVTTLAGPMMVRAEGPAGEGLGEGIGEMVRGKGPAGDRGAAQVATDTT